MNRTLVKVKINNEESTADFDCCPCLKNAQNFGHFWKLLKRFYSMYDFSSPWGFLFFWRPSMLCIPQQLPLCRMIACMHSALTGDESQVKSTVAKTKNKEMGNQHLLSPSHLTHFLYRSTYLLLYYYADSWKKIGIISKRIGYY
jgi:hypothetical protein